ncbi:hypothetical protein [Methanimicrococcus hacksteinii]|nr:hypothetical protein [Methanimicrococcus sp. At1]
MKTLIPVFIFVLLVFMMVVAVPVVFSAENNHKVSESAQKEEKIQSFSQDVAGSDENSKKTGGQMPFIILIIGFSVIIAVANYKLENEN